MGTDAYTQEELEEALEDLVQKLKAALRYAQIQRWENYRQKMRQIDLQYRQLRSQGPGLGAELTRQ